MSEIKNDFNEEIENLTALVRLAETTTVLAKYFTNKISRRVAISKIYLQDMNRN